MPSIRWISLMVVLLLVACSRPATGPQPKVTVSPESTAIPIGGQSQLNAKVENLSPPTLNWSSLSPSVATVDSVGLVKGLASGIALVCATSTVKADALDCSTVTVGTPSPSPPSGPLVFCPSN